MVGVDAVSKQILTLVVPCCTQVICCTLFDLFDTCGKLSICVLFWPIKGPSVTNAPEFGFCKWVKSEAQIDILIQSVNVANVVTQLQFSSSDLSKKILIVDINRVPLTLFNVNWNISIEAQFKVYF